jgi:putative CGCGG family rSAM target protein
MRNRSQSDDDASAIDEGADPVTDRVHDTSWSANLETPTYEADRQRVVTGALTAIEHTTAGTHVNLVTHGDHGHPEAYLYEQLREAHGESIDLEYVDQCGCGGHVVRVHVH